MMKHITTDQNNYNNINVWNYKDGSLLLSLKGHPNREYKGINPVSDFVVDKDEKFLISGGQGEELVRKWDLRTGNLLGEILPDYRNDFKIIDECGDISLSPDGLKFCYIRNDRYMYCCNTYDLKELWHHTISKNDGFFVIKWDEDNNSIYTSTLSGKFIQIDSKNGKILQQEQYSHGYIHEFFLISHNLLSNKQFHISNEERTDLWILTCDSQNSMSDLSGIIYRIWNWSKKKIIVEVPIDIADMARINISNDYTHFITFSANIIIREIVSNLIVNQIHFIELSEEKKAPIQEFLKKKLDQDEQKILDNLEQSLDTLPRYYDIDKYKISTSLDGIVIDDGHICGIGINKIVSSEISENITKFPKLICLWLNRLDLDEIPNWIYRCTGLKYIYFNFNHISNLPHLFNKLKNLECIDLCFNSFQKFPEILCSMINLSQIYISGNNIEFIPESFLNLKNLEYFFIDFNNLKEIPKGLNNLYKLKHLTFFNNNLEFLPENFGDLLDLEILTISNNKIKILPDSLGRLKNLKKLEIEKNFIEEIPPAFINLQNLEMINFRDNPIKKEPQFLLELPKLKEVLIDQNFYKKFKSFSKKLHAKGIKI